MIYLKRRITTRKYWPICSNPRCAEVPKTPSAVCPKCGASFISTRAGHPSNKHKNRQRRHVKRLLGFTNRIKLQSNVTNAYFPEATWWKERGLIEQAHADAQKVVKPLPKHEAEYVPRQLTPKVKKTFKPNRKTTISAKAMIEEFLEEENGI